MTIWHSLIRSKPLALVLLVAIFAIALCAPSAGAWDDNNPEECPPGTTRPDCHDDGGTPVPQPTSKPTQPVQTDNGLNPTPPPSNPVLGPEPRNSHEEPVTLCYLDQRGEYEIRTMMEYKADQLLASDPRASRKGATGVEQCKPATATPTRKPATATAVASATPVNPPVLAASSPTPQAQPAAPVHTATPTSQTVGPENPPSQLVAPPASTPVRTSVRPTDVPKPGSGQVPVTELCEGCKAK